MQGRDPDHDGAPGHDPAPDRGHASSEEPFGYPSFPVPDNPYDEPDDGDADDGDSSVAASAATNAATDAPTGPTDPPPEPPPASPTQAQQPDAPEPRPEGETPRGLFEPRHQISGRSAPQPSETERTGGPELSQTASGQASGAAYEMAPQAEGSAAHEPPGQDLPDGAAETRSAATEAFRPTSPDESQPQDSAWKQPLVEPDARQGDPGTPGQSPPADRATEQLREVRRAAETPAESPEPVSPDPLSEPAQSLPEEPATERFGPVRREGAVGSAGEPTGDEPAGEEPARDERAGDGPASADGEAGESAQQPPRPGGQPPGPLDSYTQQFSTLGAAGTSAARPQPHPTEPPAETPADSPADTTAGAEADTAASVPGDSTAGLTTDYPRGAAAESPEDAAAGSATDSPTETPADPHRSSAEPATDSLRLAGREPGQQPPGPFGSHESPPHPSSVPRQSPHDSGSAPTTTWQSPHPEVGGGPPGGSPHEQAQPGSRAGAPPPTNTIGHTPDLAYDVADLYRRPPKRRRGLLIASLVLVAVLVVGGGAFAYTFLFAEGVGPGQPLAGTSTPAASNAAQPSTGGGPNAAPSFDPRKVSNATADPKPLTLGEAFPEEEITVDGRKFRRVDMTMAKKCGKAAQQGFAKALRQADCARVLRATFVDNENEYAVTTGIAVLPDRPAAKSVDKAANPGENIWFAALPGPQGSGSERIHRSGGYSALEVLGRYAVFSFAAYTDKITPPPQSDDLSDVCASMRNYAAKPILQRGIVTPVPGAYG